MSRSIWFLAGLLSLATVFIFFFSGKLHRSDAEESAKKRTTGVHPLSQGYSAAGLDSEELVSKQQDEGSSLMMGFGAEHLPVRDYGAFD